MGKPDGKLSRWVSLIPTRGVTTLPPHSLRGVRRRFKDSLLSLL